QNADDPDRLQWNGCFDYECRYALLKSSAEGLSITSGSPIGNTSVRELIGTNGSGGIRWYNFTMDEKSNINSNINWRGGRLNWVKDLKKLGESEQTVKEVINRYVYQIRSKLNYII